jgi:hypothetical protein
VAGHVHACFRLAEYGAVEVCSVVIGWASRFNEFHITFQTRETGKDERRTAYSSVYRT